MTIERERTGPSEHERDERPDEHEVELVSVPCTRGHRPVEEETAGQMDRPHRDEHVDGQERRRHERERPADEEQAAGELDQADEDRQRVGGGEPELREEGGRARQAAAAPQAEQFLRSMRREDRPDCQPEYGRTKSAT